jgi:CubicO group peptidase (beta-lactamase class C family)
LWSNFIRATRIMKSFKMYFKYIVIILGSAASIISAWAFSNFINKKTLDKASQRLELAGMKISILREAVNYAGGSGIILRGEKEVYHWGNIRKLYDLKSTTKSIGVTALGLAVKDGLIDLNDRVSKYFPALGNFPLRNRETGWLSEITYFHLATHTAGFDKSGGYEPLLNRPGSVWAYSDAGTNWLADAMTDLYNQDMKELLFQRVFNILGITAADLKWRENKYREKQLNGNLRREFGSGIKANVQAMAKIGLLYLRNGKWHDKEILSKGFVDLIGKPLSSVSNLPVANDKRHRFAGASKHYGLLWWNNGDGALKNVPTDAYWSFGLHDSFIIVIPSLDVVIARAGDSIAGLRSHSHYRILEPFLELIVTSINFGAPYSNSPVISNISWDVPSLIIRKASGSDNWPMTWAKNDHLYTAYGDGYGFKPRVGSKLSLGFARVEGTPPDFSGINIRSSNEHPGDGQKGKKASGLLMVDEILYMWVRNANENGEGSQLAWSSTLGENWQWSQWLFEQFGYCTFINFGRNYDSARDDYIYSISHDDKSAYKRADRFVLMRVPKKDILKRHCYEFFQKLNVNRQPVWTKDIQARGSIFNEPEKCYRSGISYNASLQRYFWWQAKFPEGIDGKYASRSFGIFDAPEPWGPWTTVYYTNDWDVATGETGTFPAKWMIDNGVTMYLVFSGNDSFSVRKARLSLFSNSN